MSIQPSIAVVTPTWNRAELLPGLHRSLVSQSDSEFTWVVVDDASTDHTESVLEGLIPSRVAPTTVRQTQNLGKAAALNAAFDTVDVDLYLVVDSDDTLFPDAIQTVRAKAIEYLPRPEVGALFFRYLCDGSLIGPHLPAEDRVLSRADNDRTVGKYDGAVAYFNHAIELTRYPIFPGEKYVGPTVLQLLMHPRYRIAFVNRAIGEAEYQPGGLTASGRALRIANPQGMAEYSRLQRSQAVGARIRLATGLKMHAYAWLANTRAADPRPEDALLRPLGALIGRYWRRRYGVLEESNE